MTSAALYPTPLADAARARTAAMVRTYMRSQAVELVVAMAAFAGLGFAIACAI